MSIVGSATATPPGTTYKVIDESGERFETEAWCPFGEIRETSM